MTLFGDKSITFNHQLATDMMNTFDRYAGKRVLITGHTGFKGSWLTIWLHLLGAEVYGLALDPPTSPSLFDDAAVSDLIDDARIDLRDSEAVQKRIKSVRPEIVFHLAAQPLVLAGYDRAVETFEVNVMGSVHLFDALRSVPECRALVHVGTDKVYLNNETGIPFSEGDPLGGHDPYSASKAAGELALRAYQRSFFQSGKLLAASGRAGNVIGGGDWAENRLVPDAVRAWASGQSLIIRHPESIRPWQHVLTALSGYLLLGAELLSGRNDRATAWNFGPEASSYVPVEKLVALLREAYGKGEWQVQEDSGPHEAKVLKLDWSKAQKELDWRPVWTFEDAVRKTAEWYRDVHAGASARTRCEDHLQEYMAAL